MISEATTSATDLLVAADMTMYDAKDAGRDRYEIFDARDSASPHTAARISWATRIRQALRDHRFVLHVQPVVDLRTGQVAGAELLLRMLDDDDSLIQPARFLHVAERMGLAPAVDRWVTGRAVGMLQETTAIGRPVRLSVNVSAHSLNDLDFVDDIEDLVRAAGVDPQHLVFEITETHQCISGLIHPGLRRDPGESKRFDGDEVARAVPFVLDTDQQGAERAVVATGFV